MADYDNRNSQIRDNVRRNILGPGGFHHVTYVSWRSVLAGFFISTLTFTILLALCMGIGGVSFEAGQSGTGWTVTTASLIVASAILALFMGSYIAGRISNYITVRIGAVQGLVIASIFFTLILYQMGMAIGWAGKSVGSAISSIGSTAVNIMDNPQVQQTTQGLLGRLNLRSSPQEVAQGVITRLIQGNVNGARDYLAYQANITPQEAQTRIDQTREQLRDQFQQVANATSDAIGGIGWSLFALLLLGSIAATIGGGLGSKENYRHPLGIEEGEFFDMASHRAANM